METKRCSVCGSTIYEKKLVDYVYRHAGHYLLVENVPAEVCLACGTRYYEAKVLEEIERRFLAITRQEREPGRYVQMPVEVYEPT